MAATEAADVILTNGKFATLDPAKPSASAVAIKGGRFVAVGSDADVQPFKAPATRVIDLRGRCVIPGLNDSHIHVVRGGLNYTMELRWDGVPSLADAMRMLREQVKRTPAPQWVRVVGGWCEFQFAERRMPTLAELNEAAPDTPVFILHLYDRALLNAAALRAVGYDKNTPEPPGGMIERDKHGNPTGLIVAKPNALILYATLNKGPKLGYDDQVVSTRHFMRELNRLGVTSIIDAGGGFQNYPDDYEVITGLAKQGLLTLRIACNLFTQRPKQEREDFARWIKTTKPGEGDEFFRINGAGEMLVFSAADFEDFQEPRPDLPATLETELHEVVTLLAKNRWPFRLHATYDESIERFLNVFESVNRDVPFDGLRWMFDHAETITPRNIDRVKALGGGIAVQHRMAYQGEYFVDRYGKAMAEHAPPIKRMLEAGVPVGGGTDATRVASYNPFVALSWLVAGKTVGGLEIYSSATRLDRVEALKRYTIGSAWFSGEEAVKGSIEVGKYADVAVLSADYFGVPADEIKGLVSVMTMVGGKVVYAAEEFTPYDPPALPVSPSWSPVAAYGGYHGGPVPAAAALRTCGHGHLHAAGESAGDAGWFANWGWGCPCFVM